MISPELIAYIRKQTAAGASKEAIAKLLVPNGWSRQDIDQAFATLATPTAAVSAPVQAPRSPSPSRGVKILLSLFFIGASAVYAFFQYVANPPQSPVVATSIPANSPMVVKQTPVVTAPPPQQAQTTTPTPVTTPTPTPVPTPVPAPANATINGTFDLNITATVIPTGTIIINITPTPKG